MGRFSHRADMFAVAAAELTAKGAVKIFVNSYITVLGCRTTLFSDNGVQITSKLPSAIDNLLGGNKITPSSCHTPNNVSSERVNHTIARVLAVSADGRQNDIFPPHQVRLQQLR